MSELFQAFGRIGLLSFGGPAAQMALMHQEIVEKRQWLTEEDYLRALSFCMLLPGPEAMQLATYTGWKIRGVLGGILSGLLFVLPGAMVILVLAIAYGYWGRLPLTQAAFLGVKAAVIIIVATALYRLAVKTLKDKPRWIAAILSFIAIFVFSAPFPLTIAAAALFGFLTAKKSGRTEPSHAKVKTPYKAAALFAALWAIPLLSLQFFGSEFLAELAWFFSKLAVVTFGGAYAVLAYMTQATVQDFGWLSLPEMIDGLGLAETTPGPLILVTEFVGFLAAFKTGGLWFGILAALLTLWMTFIPCFLWIFLAAGHVENLTRQPRLANALSFVTAAVVGVILNLGIWFSFNTLFAEFNVYMVGNSTVSLPKLTSLNPHTVLLTIASFGLLALGRVPLGITLILMALAGVGLSMV
ncbi:chromate efflux transporter [Actibacterium pelagium]|nr:chromate efflux transporter [Actibacterium pelagium]